MLIIYNKKRREKSSEVKYTTSTIKALKTRYIALKTTQKSKIILTLLFYSYFKSNKERAYTLSLHYLPPILLLKKFVILNCSFKFIKMKSSLLEFLLVIDHYLFFLLENNRFHQLCFVSKSRVSFFIVSAPINWS